MRRIGLVSLFLYSFIITAKEEGQRGCASALLNVSARALTTGLNFIFPLRYEQKIEGLREAYGPYPKGTITSFNHPAGIIDPALLKKVLHKVMGHKQLRFIMLESEAQGLIGELAASAANAILIPDPFKDPNAKEKIANTLKQTVEALDRGENIALSISGIQYRNHLSKSLGTFLYELRKLRPHAPIIAARTNGLFGSSGSYGFNGTRPQPLKFILENGFFTATNLGANPKRPITHTFKRMENIPEDISLTDFNRLFDDFYNEGAAPNLYVPRSMWAWDVKPKAVADPVYPQLEADISKIPQNIKNQVYELVRNQLPASLRDSFEIDDETEFADLGISSLPLLELIAITEAKFSGSRIPTEITKVKELIAASQGQLVASETTLVKPVPPKWWTQLEKGKNKPLVIPSHNSLIETIDAQLRRDPKSIIMADEFAGAITKEQFAIAAGLLADRIKNLPDPIIATLFTSGVAPSLLHYAILRAGKVSFYLNPVRGYPPILKTFSKHKMSTAVSAPAIVEKLKNALPTPIPSELVEQIATFDQSIEWINEWLGELTLWQKIKGAIKHKLFGKNPVRDVKEIQTIISTSGTGGDPKEMAYTDENLSAAVKNVLEVLGKFVTQSDSIMNIMPDFHVTGLVTSVLLPLMTGIPVIHHPNGKELSKVLKLMKEWKTSIMILSPQILQELVRVAKDEDLASMRMFILGAGPLPYSFYEHMQKRFPHIHVLPVYGTTETTGAITANTPDDNNPRSIGRPLEGMKFILADSDALREGKLLPVPTGTPGKLLVGGPQIPTSYYKQTSNLDEEGNPYYFTHDGITYNVSPDFIYQNETGDYIFHSRAGNCHKVSEELICTDQLQRELDELIGDPQSGEPTYTVVWAEGERGLYPCLVTTKEETKTLREINDFLKSKGHTGASLFTTPPVTVKELPMTALKKIDKPRLKALLKEQGIKMK